MAAHLVLQQLFVLEQRIRHSEPTIPEQLLLGSHGTEKVGGSVCGLVFLGRIFFCEIICDYLIRSNYKLQAIANESETISVLNLWF